MFTSEQLCFLENKEWYNEIPEAEDIHGIGFKLTAKAPPRAIKAYNEYVATIKNSIKTELKNGKIEIIMRDY